MELSIFSGLGLPCSAHNVTLSIQVSFPVSLVPVSENYLTKAIF